jgi:ABC-2 type transport system permease protein
MRILKFILKKEFKQIFRNKALLPMIFVSPIIQLLIMPLAADFEIKNINISVVDHDRSTYSQALVSKITASGYFKLIDFGNNFNTAFQQIEQDQADLILEIPQGFEKNLVRENKQKLFIAVNAINGTKATVGGNYLSNLIGQFNSDIRVELTEPARFNPSPTISSVGIFWYNIFMNYTLFMVPGILVTLVTMVGVYMCALNIVKEKEVGTIEQINVTPIKKYHFILGKMIPFLVIGVFIFSVGLWGVARLVYGIVPQGNVLIVYAFLILFLITTLGLGLLISTYCQTQQQAMSIAFFFIMIFMLMSGLFTSIESMPTWAKYIANCSPVTYFIQVMRMVVLKGSGFSDVKFHFLIITIMGVFINTWAILNYSKTN